MYRTFYYFCRIVRPMNDFAKRIYTCLIYLTDFIDFYPCFFLFFFHRYESLGAYAAVERNTNYDTDPYHYRLFQIIIIIIFMIIISIIKMFACFFYFTGKFFSRTIILSIF